MDRHMSAALDRHITGNYGEDQFASEDIFEAFIPDPAVMKLAFPTRAFIEQQMRDEVERDSELDFVDDVVDRLDCVYEMFGRYTS